MSDSEPEQSSPKRFTWDRALSVYCGFVAFGSVLSFVNDGRLWPLNFFDALLHGLLWPAPILTGFTLAKRKWKRAAGFSLATLFLLWTCAPWFSRAPEAAAASDGDSLTVVTWNLGLKTCDAEKVAAELLRIEPDIVFFQEARADKIAIINEALADLLPYQEHFEYDLFSKAYLSRIEPTSAELITPDDTKNFLELSIPFDDSTVTITSMHTNKAFAFFGHKWFGYDRMMQQIKLAASRPTNLVLGDFNLTERNTVYHDIQATGLIDSWRERRSDPGFTFPAFGRYRNLPLPPLLRIDYVWHTSDLQCVSIERTDPADSDHRGLVARIAVR